jgi:hypothetical protein
MIGHNGYVQYAINNFIAHAHHLLQNQKILFNFDAYAVSAEKNITCRLGVRVTMLSVYGTGQDFFDLQIVLSAPKGNLEVNFGKRDKVNSLCPGGGGH